MPFTIDPVTFQDGVFRTTIRGLGDGLESLMRANMSKTELDYQDAHRGSKPACEKHEEMSGIRASLYDSARDESFENDPAEVFQPMTFLTFFEGKVVKESVFNIEDILKTTYKVGEDPIIADIDADKVDKVIFYGRFF